MSELSARQRWVLVACSLAVGLAFLDETAVVTALRRIQGDFDATSAETQWIMGAYLLALASLMAAAGRLADLYGRRRLFLVGAGLFGAGSIVSTVAPSEEVLIAARALQGAGAALLMPLGMANATSALPEEKRGWVVGIVSTGGTLFLAAGPVVGGALTELVGWRSIFAINVPVVLVIVAIALRHFPESRAPVREPLDTRGFALLVLGLVALTTALLNLQDWGAGSAATLGTLAAAVALLLAFVHAERRVAHPLVQLELLRSPAVSGLLVALFAIQFSILGLTVYLTFYLQHVLGYSAVVAGLLSLPTVIAAPILSSPTGRLTDRLGARGPTAVAMALAAVSLGLIALLSGEREVALLLPAFLIFGIARPIATVAGTAGTVGAISREARGLASALVTQARQLGAVLGVAVLGIVLTAIETDRRTELLHGVDRGFDTASREALDGILAGSDQSAQLLSRLSPDAQQAAKQAAASAITDGFRAAILVAALLATAGALAAWLLGRRATAA